MKNQVVSFVRALLLSCCTIYTIARTETILQNFNSMADLDAFWDKSSWTGSNRTHSPANVTIVNGVLALKLSGSQTGQLPVCAEITSKRADFRYGSYRASIKTTNIAGGVVGWFVYRDSPLNEIDVEFLTEDITQVHYTLHHIQTSVDYKTYKLNFDPSAAFHEYRFDWYADSVKYFIDGNPTVTLKNQVPDLDCQIMLNHWSGNISGWGGKAPAEDIFMYVDYMYYSTDYNSATPVRAGPKELVMAKPEVISQNGNLLTISFGNSSAVPSRVALYSLSGKKVPENPPCMRRNSLLLDSRSLGQGSYLLVYDTPLGEQRHVVSILR